MELHESPQVVQNLLRKRDLLLVGDRAHEEVRSALVICGGAMRGVYGAGAVVAFHRLGLAHCFDVVVGISTGAAIASYFLAGEEQTLLGTAIYYEECLNGFISFWRWPIADVDHIERVMRSGRKKLDIDAIHKHRSQFFVGATDWETGEGQFLDVKRASPEPLAAIKASFAITALYRKSVAVNGQKFTDGSTAIPFPAKKTLQTFEPTDMLVIANDARANVIRPQSWARKVLLNVFTTGLSPRVRELATRRSDLWSENLEYLRGSTANVGILWGPNAIGRLTRDRQRLRETAMQGARKILAIFGQPELSFNLL